MRNIGCQWSGAAGLIVKLLSHPMDYERFYKHLFSPIEDRIGPFDKAGIMAIVGFDCGGPISLSTVGREQRKKFVTYITCELACRKEQQPASFGRYEFMMTCDDREWAHHILTKLGQMSLESAFDHGHTVDIRRIVPGNCPLKGLITEEFARAKIGRKSFGIMQVHGVTRPELDFARRFGADKLLDALKAARIYPRTSPKRKKSIDEAA